MLLGVRGREDDGEAGQIQMRSKAVDTDLIEVAWRYGWVVCCLLMGMTSERERAGDESRQDPPALHAEGGG